MNRRILRELSISAALSLQGVERRALVGVGAGCFFGNAATALRNVYPTTQAGEQSILSVGCFESMFGQSGTFAGSNNWGAITGEGDAGHIDHGDTDASGNAYTTNFAAFSTPEAGARRLIQVLKYYDALKYAEAGDAYGMAKAMFINPSLGPGHGYYSAHTHPGTKQGTAKDFYERTMDYARAIKNNADLAASSLGQPKKVKLNDPGEWTMGDSSGGPSWFGLLMGASLIGGLWYVGFGPGRQPFYRFVTSL